MFWKRKVSCLHEWKAADFYIGNDPMGDVDKYYEIICDNCKKQRNVSEYEFEEMKDRGFIK